MAVAEMDLEGLLTRVVGEERRALIRTALLVALPVVTALALLLLVGLEIHRANRAVEAARAEFLAAEEARRAAEAASAAQVAAVAGIEAERSEAVAAVEAERDLARAEILRLKELLQQERARFEALRRQHAALDEQVRGSATLGAHMLELDWTADAFLAEQPQVIVALLSLLREMQALGVGWNAANRTEQGFLPVGFAGFVLQELELLPDGDPAERLLALPRSQRAPAPGDVVLYEGGYAMFYIRGPAERELVIGLTPVGVAALEPDFGLPRTGVIKTGLVR